ncbi:MAG: hypothetical protein WBF31_14145, partial [Anaerolineae bacterium]
MRSVIRYEAVTLGSCLATSISFRVQQPTQVGFAVVAATCSRRARLLRVHFRPGAQPTQVGFAVVAATC